MVASIQRKKLDGIFDSFAGKRIMVIGDVIVDHYISGNVCRISPEAPVPVVHVTGERTGLGGAANVANNIISLGGEAVLIGIIGSDWGGDVFMELAAKAGIDYRGLKLKDARPSTIKTRVTAQGQQVLRIDREDVSPISRKNEKILLGKIEDSLDEVGAVILEDYNKGLLTSGLIKNTIELCGERGIPVTVDPKFQHFMEYSGATLVKPNQGEVEKILGIEIHDDAGIDNVFEMLEERLECRYILLTRSAKGMVIKERGMKSHSIPTLAREVFDVSGAGDTVIAMVTLGLAADVDIFLSTFLANVAAGIGVERNGVVAVTADEVMERVTQWEIDEELRLRWDE